MLKKLTLLFAIILVATVTACTWQEEPTGEYDIVSLDSYRFEVADAIIVKNYVNDADTACAIGDAVMKSTLSEKQYAQMVGFFVEYDKWNDLWIYNRNLGPGYTGGDITCAIRRRDGKVVQFWYGE